MNQEDAVAIADKAMAKEVSWPCPCIGVKETASDWGVVYERRLPDGTPVDGPIVVVVRKSDGFARVL
jgi:hypothetical protein